ncbi:hypothetical protein AC1031_011373 [Aphanomyces cochlioides]|nr:hypothetical protein AC1031_011373 [Aphanomyces cochlioides]
MKKVKTGKAILLPSDIVVKIAFFLPCWATVDRYLEALRPADVLGPLEHLWHLRLLGWRDYYLWPRLLSPKTDEASRVHVEGISKYYSTVYANETVDLDWFRRFVDPLAAINWSWTTFFDDFDMLKKWSSFRITYFNLTRVPSANITEVLSCLQHLTILKHHACTSGVAAAIFKCAATGRYVRELELFSKINSHCTMTTAMAMDLLCWVGSNSVRLLKLTIFNWEDQDLRNTIMETALGSKSLETLSVGQTNSPNAMMTWSFDRDTSCLFLDFWCSSRLPGQTSNLDDLRGFIYLFGPSLGSKVKVLEVSGLNHVCDVWEDLARLIQSSQVETVNIEGDEFPTDNEIHITNAIRDHSTIQNLVVRGFHWSFDSAAAASCAAFVEKHSSCAMGI